MDWELGLIARHNPLLVELVEELGIEVNNDTRFNNILVEEVDTPSNRYIVKEYDGAEWVETPENVAWVEIDL